MALTTIKLAAMSANSVDSDQYVDGSIDNAHLADDAVDSAEIAAGAIDAAHMSVNSIDSDQYVDGSIDTAHIADDAVDGAKLANNIDIAGTLDVTGVATFDNNIKMADNKYLTIGTSDDLELFHNAYDSYIDNNTGDLRIRNIETNCDEIYIEAKTNINLHTAGSERLKIDSTGKVGIGEATPVGQLDIEGNVASTTQFSGFDGLRIHNANGAAHNVTADMYFTAGTSSSNRGAAIGAQFTSAASGNDLYFATNGGNVSSTNTLTERMRIASDGKVGIGTATPDMILDVTGTVTAGGGTNQDLQQWNIGSDNVKAEIKYDDNNSTRGYVFGTSTAHDLALQTNNTTRLRIAHGGDATFTGTVSDSKGDVRKIIPNSQTSSTYTLVASDAGKAIVSTQDININGGVFAAGDAVTIVNNAGSGIVLTIQAGSTMYKTADGSNGNLTLSARGMATIYFISGTVCYISGGAFA